MSANEYHLFLAPPPIISTPAMRNLVHTSTQHLHKNLVNIAPRRFRLCSNAPRIMPYRLQGQRAQLPSAVPP